MKVELKSSQAVVTPAEEDSFDPTQIRKAVLSAGFKPGDIHVTAVGTLSKEGELLALEMVGLLDKFVLAGGPKVDELSQKPQLLGQRIRVNGTLHPSHADEPPGLTVETWEEMANPV